MPVPVPPSLDDLVSDVTARLGRGSRVAALFGPCVRNALETTVTMLPDGTAFVATGDIPAMWLRDSTAQVRPYLVLAAAGDEAMTALLETLAEAPLIARSYAEKYGERSDPDRDLLALGVANAAAGFTGGMAIGSLRASGRFRSRARLSP